MRAAQPDEQPSINRAASTLTPAQETEMRRMDLNGDGIIDEKEQRAIARSTAGLRASKSMYQKGFIAIFMLLILSWIGNAGLMVAIVYLSKDLKVDGVALKNTKGGSVSTHGQKDVFEIKLTVSGRRLDEEGHSDVATVTCMNVLQAISSLEDGEDEALVKIVAEDGGICMGASVPRGSSLLSRGVVQHGADPTGRPRRQVVRRDLQPFERELHGGP